jgi:hypothetical protein
MKRMILHEVLSLVLSVVADLGGSGVIFVRRT